MHIYIYIYICIYKYIACTVNLVNINTYVVLLGNRTTKAPVDLIRMRCSELCYSIPVLFTITKEIYRLMHDFFVSNIGI